MFVMLLCGFCVSLLCSAITVPHLLEEQCGKSLSEGSLRFLEELVFGQQLLNLILVEYPA